MTDAIKLVPKTGVEERMRAGAADLLREALADVEAGKVLGVIILCKETDGMWMHRASETISVREEIGSIEMLKFDRILRTRNAVEE